MPSPKLLYPMRDWSFGMNDKDSPNLIPDNALVEAQNAVIGRGFISKRNGYTKYTTTPLTSAVQQLYRFFKNNGSAETLAVSNKTLYKDNTGALTAVPFSTITSLTSDQVQMMTYKNRTIQDVVLLADGGKLKVYNGTNVQEVVPYSPSTEEQTDPGLNDLANLTNFRAIAIKKDRIFAAAHPTVKNRISFCHHDPTLGYATFDYWPSVFFFDVATTENDEIVQLEVFRDGLVILCKRSVWYLQGDGRALADYNLIKINVPSGCIAPDSVQVVGDALFYLSDDHVYAMSATEENFVSAKIVSRNVENTLKSISQEDKAKAQGIFYQDKYYLSFPDGTCLVFDTDQTMLSWVKWTNIKANSFLNKDGVLMFSHTNGNIYQFADVYADDGTAIEFRMKTKNMDFATEVQDKKLRRLWTIAKQYDLASSNFNVTAIIDYVSINLTDIDTDQSGLWGESNWGESMWGFKDVVQNALRVRQKGKNLQLVITNNNLNEPFTLYGMALQYKLKKAK